MSYDYKNPVNAGQAYLLLAELQDHVPRGLAHIQGHADTFELQSEKSTAPWWRISKASGVHVFKEDEGWKSVVSFKDMPIGMADLVRAGRGFASRDEAIGAAIVVLAGCTRRELTPLPDETDNDLRYFIFDDVEFGVPLWRVKHFSGEILRVGRMSEDDILGELAYLRHVLTGGEPVTRAVFERVRSEQALAALVLRISAIALAAGHYSFSPDDGYYQPDEAEVLTAPSMG